MSVIKVFRAGVYGFMVTSLMLMSLIVQAAPAPEAIAFWAQADESSDATISHSDWQALLDAYLKTEQSDAINRFDYKAVSAADKQKLKQYLESLEAIDPRKFNKNQQLAYWINFYNALTVDVVLDHYPIGSIKKIRFLTSPFGPWDKNLVVVEGEKLSLNDIEHGILRPIWQDPRIHFAVNCASLGCPNLMGQAFTAENWEALMEQATSDFINHPRAASLSDGIVTLSSIFDWYRDDFGNDEDEVIDYILENRDETSMIEPGNVSSITYDYDWTLNNIK